MFSWGKWKQKCHSKILCQIVFWKSDGKQFSPSGSQHTSWWFVFLGHTHMIIQLGGLGWNLSYCYPNKTLLIQKSADSVLTVLSELGWGLCWEPELSPKHFLLPFSLKEETEAFLIEPQIAKQSYQSTSLNSSPFSISSLLVSPLRCFKMKTA